MSREIEKQELVSLANAEWPTHTSTIPSLDGIRAISVIIVLTGHMLLPVSLVGVSALGLKVFFFISGFLITRLLFLEGKLKGGVNLSGFYIRRLLRLYPVLVVYVSLVTCVHLMRGGSFDIIDLLSVFLYYVNYGSIAYDIIGEHYSLPVQMFWSLSVEEHFYLIAPLVLVFVRGSARKMLAMAALICAISLGLRILYAWIWPEIVNTLHIYWRSETRFDSIAFGVILACLVELKSGREAIKFLASGKMFLLGAAVLLFSFAFRDNYFQNTWRFTIQGLALIPVIAGVVFAEPFPWINRLLNTRVLMWIGALSYSLYVWHGGVMFLFSSWIFLLPSHFVGAAEVAISVLLACISYYCIERPVLRLRKRFQKSASPVSEPAVSIA